MGSIPPGPPVGWEKDPRVAAEYRRFLIRNAPFGSGQTGATVPLVSLAMLALVALAIYALIRFTQ